MGVGASGSYKRIVRNQHLDGIPSEKKSGIFNSLVDYRPAIEADAETDCSMKNSYDLVLKNVTFLRKQKESCKYADTLIFGDTVRGSNY